MKSPVTSHFRLTTQSHHTNRTYRGRWCSTRHPRHQTLDDVIHSDTSATPRKKYNHI